MRIGQSSTGRLTMRVPVRATSILRAGRLLLIPAGCHLPRGDDHTVKGGIYALLYKGDVPLVFRLFLQEGAQVLLVRKLPHG